jgi:hypothetical protein
MYIYASKTGELAAWFPESDPSGECVGFKILIWRVGRVVECGGLENR